MKTLYRALKLGTTDKYVEGFYAYDECHNRHLILTNSMHGLSETRIDETTLAIHFKDMKDSEDKEIFAALNEDGKGGDNFKFKDDIYDDNNKFTLVLSNMEIKKIYFVSDKTKYSVDIYDKENMIQIGIQS